jgi:hypothetical protein
MIILKFIALWVFTLMVVYPLSKVTTIGNKIWFGDIMYSISEKVTNKRIKDWLVRLSYSKLFVCVPCHSFWLTLLTSSMIVEFPSALFHSFITYFLILIYHDKKQR